MNAFPGAGRVVLVDKPAGWTSYDVVRRAKRGLKAKVGHAGTLDPFATGLLLVLLGQATRVSSLLMELPKEYLVTVQFGVRSSTGDPTGELEQVAGSVGRAEVLSALEGFRGPLLQRVPMTSAVKVAGERLYHKARRGESIVTPEREVMVYDGVMLSFDEDSQQARLLLRTGKGAYVRQLAADLGESLGTAAYALSLRRTRSGIFSVEDALPAEELSPERLAGAAEAVLPLSEALAFLPRAAVAGKEAERVANGNELAGGAGRFPVGRFLVLVDGRPRAVYRSTSESARPLVVFPEPQD
jgi:tRNA pseudouridine55 synthase